MQPRLKKRFSQSAQQPQQQSCLMLLPCAIQYCSLAMLAWWGLASRHDSTTQGDPRSRCATRVLHKGQRDLCCTVPKKSKFHLDSSVARTVEKSFLSTRRKPQHVLVIVGEGQHDASFSWVFQRELEVARVSVQQRLKVSVPAARQRGSQS